MNDPWSPRYFTADEQSAGRLVELLAQAYPQLPRKSVKEVLEAHTRGLATGRPYQRVVCGPSDAIWASAQWRVPPVLARNDIVLFDVVVAEAYRGQGHGSRLLGTVVDAARACGAAMLGAMVFDTDPRAIRWLVHCGFEPVQTEQWTALDLTRPLPATVESVFEGVRSDGVDLVDGEALARRFPQDWADRWYEIEAAVELDVPSPIPQQKMNRAEWERRCAAPDVEPWGFIFAVDGDTVVGLTGTALYGGDPSVAIVRLTGTARTHRRRGIATALKVASCRALKKRGVTRVITQNERDNPMLDLNVALGFEPSFKAIKHKGDVADVAARLAGRE